MIQLTREMIADMRVRDVIGMKVSFLPPYKTRRRAGNIVQIGRDRCGVVDREDNIYNIRIENIYINEKPVENQ